ncbi:hypothetical protein NA57DRAFT_10708, partial [Rhizodiscina lignyota]
RNFSGIRRTRPSYSCENCRLRRVKCDQVHPKCGNCTRNGTVCSYPSAPLKRKSPSEDPVCQQGKTSRRKVDEPTHFRHGHLSLQNGGRSRYTENTFWACVDVEGLELDSLLSDLPLFPLESVCCAADDSSRNNPHSMSCRHFVGTTEPNFSFWVSRRPNIVEGDSRSLAGTLVQLPPRATCDQLYTIFLAGVHPLIPLIYLPAFDKQYQRFWSWYEHWNRKDIPEGVLLENPSFLPLLLAVLFAGSIAASNMEPGRTPSPSQTHNRELQAKLYNLASDALTLVGFPHNPAIYSLIAFLFIQSMLILEEESLSSVSFVAVAFRICQAMGIHKDGTNFGLHPIQVEERRRVWCHLMHLDVMTSMISGLPLIASSEAFCTTQMIGELRDEWIGKEREASAENTHLYPGYILAAGRYDATSVIRNILLRQFAPTPMKSTDVNQLKGTIERLSQRSEERAKRLAALNYPEAWAQDPTSHGVHSPPLPATLSDVEAFDGWSRDLLVMMVEKAYCVLYQPLMQELNLWQELRTEAIPHFQANIRIFLRLCSTKSYKPFQWLYPGAYQPLQPAAVLLVDLAKEPNSPQAAESRILLEQVFSLLGPEGRVGAGVMKQRHFSDGAKNAWERLEKLRRKVWKKLGLDSSVLWSRTIARGQEQDIPGSS